MKSVQYTSQPARSGQSGKHIFSGNEHGGSTIITLLLILILGVLLAATNPDEKTMRKKIRTELTPTDHVVNFMEMLSELLGNIEVDYSDYIVCSTLSMDEKGEEKRLLAFGVAGQVFILSKMDHVKKKMGQFKETTEQLKETAEQIKKKMSQLKDTMEEAFNGEEAQNQPDQNDQKVRVFIAG